MSRFFANGYDFVMGPLEKKKLKSIRRQLLSKATGNVLEIGAGTGVNFPIYKKAEKVVAIDPSQHMLEHALLKKGQTHIPIELIQANAEELPFADHTFDTIVATLVFCTIPHPEKAIEEIKRVCKPGGKVLLLEHVKMENRFLAVLQEWLTPAWKKICDGCCLNRDTLGLLKDHKFIILKEQSYYNGLLIFVEAAVEK